MSGFSLSSTGIHRDGHQIFTCSSLLWLWNYGIISPLLNSRLSSCISSVSCLFCRTNLIALDMQPCLRYPVFDQRVLA